MKNKKILIVGPAWVGDMIMAQTLFKVLCQQNPRVIIDVLAPVYTASLLERMPEVHKVIAVDLRHGELGLIKRYQLGRSLKAEHYDKAFVLPNSFKSALIPFFASIPVRTGWRGEWRYGLLSDVRVLNQTKYPLMIERFMALAFPKDVVLPKPYPKPNFSVDPNNVRDVLNRYKMQPTQNQNILAICPGAEYGPAKQWPPEYCAEVANQLLNQGWQVWLFGSKKDQPIAKVIMDKTQQRCVDLSGKTTLGEAVDLLSVTTVVLTNDSGLMHVAAALDKQMIAIYGSSSPGFTPPLSDHAKIMSLGLECSPCFKRECPFGHYRCLKEITPKSVLKEIIL